MKMKNVLKKVTALALSAVMTLGMNVGVYAGTAVGTLPSGDGETLENATELTRDNLGPTEVNIITKDYTNKLGNAVSYNQGVTYVAGYPQFSDNTDIQYLQGLKMDVIFSRPIDNPETVDDPDVDEWFEFVSGNSVSAVDVFGNSAKESQCALIMPSYDAADKMTYDYILTDQLYNITDADLNTKYGTTQKPMAFIVAVHNIKDDININYVVPNNVNGYLPMDGIYATDGITIKDGSVFKISPSMVRLARYTVTFKNDDGTVIKTASAKDSETGMKVAQSDFPIPATVAGKTFASWKDSNGNLFTEDTIVGADTTVYATYGDKVTNPVTPPSTKLDDTSKSQISGNDFDYDKEDGALTADKAKDLADVQAVDKDGNKIPLGNITVDPDQLDAINNGGAGKYPLTFTTPDGQKITVEISTTDAAPSIFNLTFVDKDNNALTGAEYTGITSETIKTKIPAGPEVPGYTFLGWSADDGNTFLATGSTITENTTYKAVYKKVNPATTQTTDVSKIVIQSDRTSVIPEDFTFTLVKEGVTNTLSTMTSDTMPVPTNATFTINKGAWTTAEANNNGNKTITNGFNPAITFTAPGIYTYILTETAGSADGMTYSKEAYRIKYNVAYDDADTTNNTVKILNVTISKIKAVDGAVIDPAEKVEAPSFTNKYDTATLKVEKKVDGNSGDRNYGFAFEIALNDTGVHSAQVFNADGTKSGEALTSTAGKVSANLKHGQYVMVYGLVNGTGYTVTEANDTVAAAYKTSTLVTTGGTAGTASESATGADAKIATGTVSIDGVNSVLYTNSKGIQVDTGARANVGVFAAILAILMIGGMAVMATRKKSRQ